MTMDCPYCGITVAINSDGKIDNHKPVGSDSRDPDCKESGKKYFRGDHDYLDETKRVTQFS